MRELKPRSNEVVVYGLFTPVLNANFPSQQHIRSIDDNSYFDIVSNNVIVQGVVLKSELEESDKEYIDVVIDRSFTDRKETKESYQSLQRRQKRNSFARSQNVKPRPKRIKVTCKREFITEDRDELEETINFYMGIEFDGHHTTPLVDGETYMSHLIMFFRETINSLLSEHFTNNEGFSIGIGGGYPNTFLAKHAIANGLETLFRKMANDEWVKFDERYQIYKQEDFINQFASVSAGARSAGKSGMFASAMKSLYGATGIPPAMLKPVPKLIVPPVVDNSALISSMHRLQSSMLNPKSIITIDSLSIGE